MRKKFQRTSFKKQICFLTTKDKFEIKFKNAIASADQSSKKLVVQAAMDGRSPASAD